MIKKIKMLLQNQIDNYKIKFVQKKRKNFFEIQKSIYKNLIDRVLSYNFRKIHKQYLLFKNISKKQFLNSCTKMFETT